MDPTDQDGERLLAPLRNVEPGRPSTVSVHRAIHAGARRQRARQVIGAVVVVGIVALGAAVLPSILSGRQHQETATQPGEFDVLRREFGMGSAAGFTPVSYETGRYRQRVRLVPADGADATPDRATVTMYARGWLPDLDGAPWQPAGDPAPEVNGHRAFWLPSPVTERSGTELTWEWAPGAWAFAHVDGVGADLRGKVHRIAQSVEPGAHAAVTLPFTLPSPGPNDPNQLVGVISPFGTSSDITAGGLLVFGRFDPVQPGGADQVRVGVSRDLARDLVTGGPRDPAMTRNSVTIPDVGAGYSAIAETNSAELASPQRLTELATAVRLVDNPADQRSWTGVPLR
jgi:hypothetical protein